MTDSVNVTYVGGDGEPDTNEWRGYSFDKGKPVAVTDPHIIEKAKTNRFFEVEGHKKRPDEKPDHDDELGELEKMSLTKVQNIAERRGIVLTKENGDAKSKTQLIQAIRA